jgi:glycine cleavage system H protein
MSLYFTEEHQWARLSDDGLVATIGISHHAQDALGDIVFVDLPEIGKSFSQFDVGAVVESVKTAADVLVGVSGTVVEVNDALRNDPALANTDPMASGWFFKMRVEPAAAATEVARLIDESSYAPS